MDKSFCGARRLIIDLEAIDFNRQYLVELQKFRRMEIEEKKGPCVNLLISLCSVQYCNGGRKNCNQAVKS